MERTQKEVEVKNFSDRLENSKITICADYRGVTVAAVTKLRADLKEAGCYSKVFKNTLAKISVEQVLAKAEAAEKEKFLKIFEGPSFVVFAEQDPVTAAKILDKFAKDSKVFQVKGGWFDGSFLNQEGVEAVAKLPGKEESLAKLLSLLNTPATQLVRLLQAPAAQFARVIGAYKDKLEKGI